MEQIEKDGYIYPKNDEDLMFPWDFKDGDTDGVKSCLEKSFKNPTFLDTLFFLNIFEEFRKRAYKRERNEITIKYDSPYSNFDFPIFIRELYMHITSSLNEVYDVYSVSELIKIVIEIYTEINEFIYMNNTTELNKKIQRLESGKKKINKLVPLFVLGVETHSFKESEISIIYEEIQIISKMYMKWIKKLREMRHQNKEGKSNGSNNRTH